MRKAIIIPHYNTPKQLNTLLSFIPHQYHQDILIVDDHSTHPPTSVVGQLHRHAQHRGYGGAQKTGYKWAIDQDYQQVLLVHGDNQYSFEHIWEAAQFPSSIAIGSRLQNDASHRMPLWRMTGNKLLTGFANVLFQQKHSDLHSGARIFSIELLKKIPFDTFSDGFLFDQQLLAYCLSSNIDITEFSIPADYSTGVSSISARSSLWYGLGCLVTLLRAKQNI